MAKFTDLYAESVKDSPSGRAPLDLPPEGSYTATIEHHIVKPTKAGDKFRLALKCVVDSGPHAGQGGWYSTTYDSTNGFSIKTAGDVLTAVGGDLSDLDGYDTDDGEGILTAIAEAANGARVQIKVGTKANSDRGPEVRFINPLPADAPPSQRDTVRQGVAKVAAARKPSAGPSKGRARL